MTTAEQVLILTIYVLATARVTRLINHDQVFNPARNRYLRIFSGHYLAAYFITCPWCVGLWASIIGAVVPVGLFGWSWWAVLPVGLAASMLIGVASPLSVDDEMKVIAEDDDDEDDAP